MTLDRQAVGRHGERLAEAHLLDMGAELLERNYRADHGEIDLLLKHEGELVAVEVKTRDVEDLEQPEEAIHRRQLCRISRSLTTYALDNDLLELPFRVDVVLVVTQSDGSLLRLDHLRSVYPW
jgi:putative endonuclease